MWPVCVAYWMDRDTDRKKQTDRETGTDKQTDRDRQTQTGRLDGRTARQTDGRLDRQTDGRLDRQIDAYIHYLSSRELRTLLLFAEVSRVLCHPSPSAFRRASFIAAVTCRI